MNTPSPTSHRSFLKNAVALSAAPGLLSTPQAQERPSRAANSTVINERKMNIGFHTDAFNSAYWSFEKCLA